MPYYQHDPRWIAARYGRTCAGCGAEIRKGERIYFYPLGQKSYGNSCGCGLRADRDFEAARFDEEMVS